MTRSAQRPASMRPAATPSARAPLPVAAASERRGDASLAVAQGAAPLAGEALAVLEPARLLEHRDAGVGVAAQAEAGAGGGDGGERRQAVAEVGLGQRADADVAAGGDEALEVRRVGVGAVDGGERVVDLQLVEQQGHRPLAVGRLAVGDLLALLLDVHVEGQAAAAGLGVEIGDLARRRGADRVGDAAQALAAVGGEPAVRGGPPGPSRPPGPASRSAPGRRRAACGCRRWRRTPRAARCGSAPRRRRRAPPRRRRSRGAAGRRGAGSGTRRRW